MPSAPAARPPLGERIDNLGTRALQTIPIIGGALSYFATHCLLPRFAAIRRFFTRLFTRRPR